ncbi:MAG: hypothetical protein HYX67_09230 [Candidatus Melainabacteria bacterium]|nr:hypothetical protein [Candidatus Melainabacteria bacterium]
MWQITTCADSGLSLALFFYQVLIAMAADLPYGDILLLSGLVLGSLACSGRKKLLRLLNTK